MLQGLNDIKLLGKDFTKTKISESVSNFREKVDVSCVTPDDLSMRESFVLIFRSSGPLEIFFFL